MNNIIKISTIILSFLIIVFGVAYALKLPILEKILSGKILEIYQSVMARQYFPETIGQYKLFEDISIKVETKKRCNKIEDNPILKATGRTGDACMETFVAEYRTPMSSTTTDIIRVNLSRFTENKDMFELLIENSSDPDTLDGLAVFRLAPFELGWYPSSVFDLIVTQDGEAIVGTSSIKYEYAGTAIGENEVTRYFLSKYSPRKL